MCVDDVQLMHQPADAQYPQDAFVDVRDEQGAAFGTQPPVGRDQHPQGRRVDEAHFGQVQNQGGPGSVRRPIWV